MVCGWSLLSLTRHLLPTLHPRMLDVCMLSSDGTGSYLCVSILYVLCPGLSPACWGDLTPYGYQGLHPGLAMGGPLLCVLVSFHPSAAVGT